MPFDTAQPVEGSACGGLIAHLSPTGRPPRAHRTRYAASTFSAPYLRPYRGPRCTCRCCRSGCRPARCWLRRLLLPRSMRLRPATRCPELCAGLAARRCVGCIASGARFYRSRGRRARVRRTLRRDLFRPCRAAWPAWFEVRSERRHSRSSADAQPSTHVIGSSPRSRCAPRCVHRFVHWLVNHQPQSRAVRVGPCADRGGRRSCCSAAKVPRVARKGRRALPTWLSEGGETRDRGAPPCRAFRPGGIAPAKSLRLGDGTYLRRRPQAVSRGVPSSTNAVIFIVFAAVGFLLWMGRPHVISATSRRDFGLLVYACAGGDLGRRHAARRSATFIAPRVRPNACQSLAPSRPAIVVSGRIPPLPKPFRAGRAVSESSFR